MLLSKRLLIGFLGLTSALSLMLPLSANATSIYSNGGSYFSAYGPSYYWHYDWGEGYCGKFGSWCGPRHAQWTYQVYGQFGSTNHARWWPIVEGAYSRAYAFIPRRNATTTGAEYTTVYAGISRKTSFVNQLAYYDQWAALNYGRSLWAIRAIDLTDSTWNPDNNWRRIAFDEIKIEN